MKKSCHVVPIKTTVFQLVIVLFLFLFMIGCSENSKPENLERILNDGIITLALPTGTYATRPNQDIQGQDPLILNQVYEGLINKNGNSFIKGGATDRFVYNEASNSLSVYLKKDYTFSNDIKIDSLSLNFWLEHMRSQGIDIKYISFSNQLEISTLNATQTLEKLASPDALLYTIKDKKAYGSGPFYLDRLSDSLLILKKNPSYIEKDAVRLKQINVRFIDTLKEIADGLMLGTIDVAILDPVATFHLESEWEGKTPRTLQTKLQADSLLTKLTFAKKDSLWVPKFINPLYTHMKLDSIDLGFNYILDSLPNDSVPIIQHDSNYFSLQSANLLSGEFSNNVVDSSRFVSITTLSSAENINVSLSNQEQMDVVINYWSGKIVYQYYVKNIEYFNDRIIDFKRVYLEKAILLNP